MRKALETLPWVRQVQVSFERKEALVTAEANRYDEKALLRALTKAGYFGKVIKREP